MDNKNMELQAIRNKLQLLEAEPPAAETIAMPWSAPQLPEAVPASGFSRSPESYPQANRSPQAIAIEALKHRSGNTLINAQQNSANGSAASVADNLVAKALYKLEVQAHSINVRSQQQAQDLIEMKRTAQQAVFELSQQGIHEHPLLCAIANLFDDTETADLPHIERDGDGYFALSYDAIQIDSAQQSALEMANALRERSQGNFSKEAHRTQKLFLEPIAPSPGPSRIKAVDSSTEESIPSSHAVGRRVKASIHNVSAKFNNIRRKRRRSRRDSSELQAYYAGGEFSWMDAAIWFSGGAIARIVAQLAIANYPWLATPLLAGIVGTILFVIYRVVFSSSSDYSSAYRLFIAMLGLLSVGLF